MMDVVSGKVSGVATASMGTQPPIAPDDVIDDELGVAISGSIHDDLAECIGYTLQPAMGNTRNTV